MRSYIFLSKRPLKWALLCDDSHNANFLTGVNACLDLPGQDAKKKIGHSEVQMNSRPMLSWSLLSFIELVNICLLTSWQTNPMGFFFMMAPWMNHTSHCEWMISTRVSCLAHIYFIFSFKKTANDWYQSKRNLGVLFPKCFLFRIRKMDLPDSKSLGQ